MKVLQRYRDPSLAKQLLQRVRELAGQAVCKLGRPPLVMEVCGTHTTAVGRAGLRGLLEDRLDLRSGPGCPVCVTAVNDLDEIAGLARLRGVTVATFGDMVRVPGSGTSLELERARGAAVKVFYSPLDAVDYAAAHPARRVVFLGVGFETTAPMAALSIARAGRRGVRNFHVLSLHKLIPPVLRALLEQRDGKLDGLLLPGHVCAVAGRSAFDFLARDYGTPAVVAGFEVVDILGALHELLAMILAGEPRVLNGYPRLVREEGNPEARELVEAIFEPAGATWRGFGAVPQSGLRIRREYAAFDAGSRLGVPQSGGAAVEPSGCRCGELLRGKIRPAECALLGKGCTPENPAGPCMVSAEGACAAFYRYERR